MLGRECWCWDNLCDYYPVVESKKFSLPSPLPKWPQGMSSSNFVVFLYVLSIFVVLFHKIPVFQS